MGKVSTSLQERSRQRVAEDPERAQQHPLALQFVDNRHGTAAFNTLQQSADNSCQSKQLQAAQGMMNSHSNEDPQSQQQENETGLPDRLKAGIESLSGVDMSSVRVHCNSDKPAQLNALAYAQGNDIHLGPGQERHLPHEAWHVVQQKQGRVKPTNQMAGVHVNDDPLFEKEADIMGSKALGLANSAGSTEAAANTNTAVQCKGEGNRGQSNASVPSINQFVQVKMGHCGVSGSGLGASSPFIIQRKVLFSESDEASEAIVVEAWIRRPDGTSSSGPHTSAISLFQQTAMNAILYQTYHGALHNLQELILAIRELPGYLEARDDLDAWIAELSLQVEHALADDNSINWGNNLEEIATQYILTRERVPYTHHEPGMGAGGGAGEGPALGRLHEQVMAIQEGKKVLPKEVANNVLGLLDLRNMEKKSGSSHLAWELHAATLLSQHLLSLYQAYPVLRNDPRIHHWIIALVADQLGIGPDRFSHVLGHVKSGSVRDDEAVYAELEAEFVIGHADGTNNECLLHTIVQQLAMNGVWVGPGAVTQAGLHQFLVGAGVINDGDMIDVYNINVAQAIAAQFNVRFQVIQILPSGRIVRHPIIGAAGPLLHIMHQGAHFSPLYPR